MSTLFRVIIEGVDELTGETISRDIAKEYKIKKPEHIDEIGINYAEQLSVIQSVMDHLISHQSSLIYKCDSCPQCGSKIDKDGKHGATLHAMGTDHKVNLQKYRCRKCGWLSTTTLKTLFGSDTHTDLIKLQATLGSSHSFRKSIHVLEMIAGNHSRTVNNREKIKKTTNRVGEIIEEYNKAEVKLAEIEQPVETLILQVDAAHIKNKEKGKRSFEAMSATIYKPEDIVAINDKRNEIKHKRCVVSSLDDKQETMKMMVINCATRYGMTCKTKVVALSDGAANCSSIINSLVPSCQKVEQILDWFHIAKRFQNILTSLPDIQKEEMEHAKWKLWHGKSADCIMKLTAMLGQIEDDKLKKKTADLIGYLTNNIDFLINYDQKHERGEVYASSIAESMVESMVNSRYRVTGKMQWSRESSHKSLQVRAAIYCKTFDNLWKMIVPKFLEHATA